MSGKRNLILWTLASLLAAADVQQSQNRFCGAVAQKTSIAEGLSVLGMTIAGIDVGDTKPRSKS